MKSHTTVRSWGALALGLIFTGVTACTVLKDVVWDHAPFTIAHVQTAAALLAAITTGHLIWPTLWHQGRVPASVGLLAIFFASTGYIIVSAGARNAEVVGVKAATINKANQARAAAREVLALAEADTKAKEASADEATRAAAKECGTGKKMKCEGKVETREAAKDDLTKAKDAQSSALGKLLLLGPDEEPYAGYKHVAETLEALGYGTADKTAAKLELLMPFALVLISELATLVFMSMAFGVRIVQLTKPDVPDMADDVSDGPFPSAEIIPFRPKSPDGKATKAEAFEDLMMKIDNGEDVPMQEVLVERWNRPKQTVSDWIKEWRSLGLIPDSGKVGRCKPILAAA